MSKNNQNSAVISIVFLFIIFGILNLIGNSIGGKIASVFHMIAFGVLIFGIIGMFKR